MRQFKTVGEIMNELEKGQYNYYGFRSLNEHDLEIVESGRTHLDVSHVWEDGVDTGEELPGTCAININDYMNESEIKHRYEMCCKTYRNLLPNVIIALIADNRSEWGGDENEIILGDSGYGADIIGYVSLYDNA